MSTLPSRRSSTRRDIAIPCQIIRKRDFMLVADRTLDLSTEGVLAPAKKTLAVGELVIVSFAVPGAWIDAEAIVARVIQGRRPGDEGPALGMMFTEMDAQGQSALALYLHGKPPPLPRRGPLSRLRRGEPAPVLADQDLMLSPLPGPMVADERDVESVPEQIDPAAILRALVGAWQNLRIE